MLKALQETRPADGADKSRNWVGKFVQKVDIILEKKSGKVMRLQGGFYSEAEMKTKLNWSTHLIRTQTLRLSHVVFEDRLHKVFL